MRFLFNEAKAKGKYHHWDGEDTRCRLWSTGGINQAHHGWIVVDTPPERVLCHMCKKAASGEQARKGEMTKQIDELMAAVDAYAKSEYARAIAGRAPSDHEPERNAVAAVALRMAEPPRMLLTHVDIANIERVASEYESLLARWQESRAGSQEVANLHATFQARERALGQLAEGGLFRRLAGSFGAAPAATS